MKLTRGKISKLYRKKNQSLKKPKNRKTTYKRKTCINKRRVNLARSTLKKFNYKKTKNTPEIEPKCESIHSDIPLIEKDITEQQSLKKTKEIDDDSITENLDIDKPDTENLDTDKPDTDKQDTEKLDIDKLDTDKPDTDKPDTEKLDTENLDTDKPDTDKPNTDKPDTDKPNTDKQVSITFNELIKVDENVPDEIEELPQLIELFPKITTVAEKENPSEEIKEKISSNSINA
jgi:hypothetical protein